MAEAKVKVRKLEDGAHELGAEIDGVFVPFVRQEAANIEAAVTRAKEMADREGES